jgi:hypothetical protein
MDERAVELCAAAITVGAAYYCCCLPAAAPRNKSYFFVKPHANNAAVDKLVRSVLSEAGIAVDQGGSISAEAIDEGGLIDRHYGTLAERAMSVPPLDLPVWAAKSAAFEAKAGMSPEAAVKAGKLLNLKQAMALLPSASPLEIEAQWRAGECVKLAPGTYVAKLSEAGVWVVNGFCACLFSSAFSSL